MNRRKALKLTAIATVAAATAMQAYDKKLIVNEQDIKIKDPKNPTKSELKHSPEITLGNIDSKGYTQVDVTVGQQGIIHPSTSKHWIYEIELYADGNKVGMVSLEPEISRGHLSTRVNLEYVKKLSAVAKCNLHGNYTSEVMI